MGESNGSSNGVNLRLIYFICFILGFILLFIGFHLIAIILMILAFIIFIYDYFRDSDYYIHDFGYFSAKIHNKFDGKWEEYTDDTIPSTFGCNVKQFRNVIDTGKKTYESKNTAGSELNIKREDMPTNGYFEIYYIEFNSASECSSNKNEIKKLFKEKSGDTSHYSSNNVHIVFRCYIMGFSHDINQNIYYHDPFIYNLSSVQHYTITRKASKSVKLKQ